MLVAEDWHVFSAVRPLIGEQDTAAGSGPLYLQNEAFSYLGAGRVTINGKQMAAFISEFEATDGPQPAPSDPIYLLIYVESGDDGGGFGETAISKEE